MASSSQTTPAEETATQLVSATKGFDYLFSNDIAPAKELFSKEDTPFHLLGLGVCAFLEAALSLEVSLDNADWRDDFTCSTDTALDGEGGRGEPLLGRIGGRCKEADEGQ